MRLAGKETGNGDGETANEWGDKKEREGGAGLGLKRPTLAEPTQ